MIEAALVERSLAVSVTTPIARVLDPRSQTLVRFDQKSMFAAPRASRGNSSTSMGGGMGERKDF